MIMLVLIAMMMVTSIAYGVKSNFDHKPAVSSKNKSKEIDRAFKCEVYSTRLFEQKMLDGGIIKVVDMTVCDDKECTNCKDTNDARDLHARYEKNKYYRSDYDAAKSLTRARLPHSNSFELQKFEWLRANDPRYKGYTFKDYQFQERIRRTAMVNVNKPEEIVAKPEKKNPQYKPYVAHKPHRSRQVEVNGKTVTRPASVPSFAEYSVCYDPSMLTDFILWKWSYPDTCVMTHRQNISSECFEILDGGGRMAKKSTEVYDPDSGEHLGTYDHPVKFEVSELEKKKALLNSLIHSQSIISYHTPGITNVIQSLENSISELSSVPEPSITKEK